MMSFTHVAQGKRRKSMETRSKLATVHYWTKNYSSRNGKKVSKIIIHHMAGNLDAKGCYNVWKNRQGSAHYAISSKGQIGQLIDEKYRAWSVANAAADSIAVTMELANDGGAKTNWHVSDKAIAKCIELCVDICKRHGIKKLNFTGDTKGNLVMHRYYMATACPGTYLASKFKYIANEVNKRLSGSKPAATLYRVRKSWADAKSQIGAYNSLENAKKAADSKTGYNVYDDKGNLVYAGKKKEVMYRVRKTWADEKSQVGAYKSLDNAKKVCDQHAGYSVYDETGKAVYTSKKKDTTKQDAMCKWAENIANNTKYHYVRWKGGVKKTQTCPICTGRKYDDYYGGNCIWFAWASWHHGAGLKNKCNCGVISNDIAEKILSAKTDAEALKIAQKYVGLKDIMVIRNKNGIAKSKWQAGDVGLMFKGNTYIHTFLVDHGDKIIDSNSVKTASNQIAVRSNKNYSAKVIIRYIGK